MAGFFLSEAFIRNGLPTTQNRVSPKPIRRQSLWVQSPHIHQTRLFPSNA